MKKRITALTLALVMVLGLAAVAASGDKNIAVTPICPHALYARSYILDRSRMVTVTPGEHSRRTAYLSVDGSKAFRLADHDQVELRRARGKARLVRLTDRSFYTVLNQKLGRR